FVAEDGPSATEYAILLALLILVAVAAIGGIGSRVYNIYQNIDSTVSGAAGI
nr:Flp family type IVb pilin [Planctomycetales bacterium]